MLPGARDWRELQMTAAAQKVTILVSEFQIQAYQLTVEGQNLLLFTHRQIGEIVGKTKATAMAISQTTRRAVSPTSEGFHS